MEADKSPMPKIDLFPQVAAIGHFIKRLVSLCPLASPYCEAPHFEHPLDTPVEPVRDWPGGM